MEEPVEDSESAILDPEEANKEIERLFGEQEPPPPPPPPPKKKKKKKVFNQVIDPKKKPDAEMDPNAPGDPDAPPKPLTKKEIEEQKKAEKQQKKEEEQRLKEEKKRKEQEEKEEKKRKEQEEKEAKKKKEQEEKAKKEEEKREKQRKEQEAKAAKSKPPEDPAAQNAAPAEQPPAENPPADPAAKDPNAKTPTPSVRNSMLNEKIPPLQMGATPTPRSVNSEPSAPLPGNLPSPPIDEELNQDWDMRARPSILKNPYNQPEDDGLPPLQPNRKPRPPVLQRKTVPYGLRNQSVDFDNFNWPPQQGKFKKAKQMEEEDYDFVTIRTDLLTATNPYGQNRSVIYSFFIKSKKKKVFYQTKRGILS
jgi:flagellar biosynthesis GTPase FlhF